MEDSKSMKERAVSLSTDAHLAMPVEDKCMTENNGIGPEINRDIAQCPDPCNVSGDTKGMETRPEGMVVDFERLLSDFRCHQDTEGKFKLLDGKYHLEIVSTSIQLFENGELLGVMFPGDKLDLDFGAQTAKVIDCPMKEDSKELTFGQKAVKATFDPSGDPRVIKAKQLIADAIDLLEEVHQEKTNNGAASSTWFRNVFRTEAFNQLVNASSSLVKYLTWQD